MLFSKSINTVAADPIKIRGEAIATFDETISAAVKTALAAGVFPRTIIGRLTDRIESLNYIAHVQSEQRNANDPEEHERLAREEEARNAEELARQQAEYRADVARRSEA